MNGWNLVEFTMMHNKGRGKEKTGGEAKEKREYRKWEEWGKTKMANRKGEGGNTISLAAASDFCFKSKMALRYSSISHGMDSMTLQR